MSYTPNFKDPRVHSRCQRAIGFACGVMSTTRGHGWSTRYIDRYLGKSGNALGRYLRANLLICTDEYHRFGVADQQGICKKYKLNSPGLIRLKDNLKLALSYDFPLVLQVARQDHEQELTTGNFSYTDQSNRLWHPLQRYRKQNRQQILAGAGYEHSYDIECAAPTILHQYSSQIPEILSDSGRWQQGPMDLYLSALRSYLSDRTQIRRALAHESQLPVAAVKEIITALFAGAAISRNPRSDIYDILNGDLARIEWFKQNEFITELRNDIRCMWEYIRPVMQKRTRTQANGTERLCPITGQQKWQVYFAQERRVLTAIRTYLDQRGIRYFLIHDGWSSDTEINPCELADSVRAATGYKLKFEHTKLTVSSIYPIALQVKKPTLWEQAGIKAQLPNC